MSLSIMLSLSAQHLRNDHVRASERSQNDYDRVHHDYVRGRDYGPHASESGSLLDWAALSSNLGLDLTTRHVYEIEMTWQW